MKFNPLWITGKTIARVEMNVLKGMKSNGGDAHDPVIYFTDGSYIRFSTEETKEGAF